MKGASMLNAKFVKALIVDITIENIDAEYETP